MYKRNKKIAPVQKISEGAISNFSDLLTEPTTKHLSSNASAHGPKDTYSIQELDSASFSATSVSMAEKSEQDIEETKHEFATV